MNTVNPILVLVGATAKAGNSMFANELVNVSCGTCDAMDIIKRNDRLSGFHPVTLAMVIDDKFDMVEHMHSKGLSFNPLETFK